MHFILEVVVTDRFHCIIGVYMIKYLISFCRLNNYVHRIHIEYHRIQKPRLKSNPWLRWHMYPVLLFPLDWTRNNGKQFFFILTWCSKLDSMFWIHSFLIFINHIQWFPIQLQLDDFNRQFKDRFCMNAIWDQCTLPAKSLEYSENTMEILVYDILIYCKWLGTNHK